jgi:hypothetical protein
MVQAEHTLYEIYANVRSKIEEKTNALVIGGNVIVRMPVLGILLQVSGLRFAWEGRKQDQLH